MNVAVATSYMSGDFKEVFPDLSVIGSEENIPKDLDLLILTGGGDISPARYGEHLEGSYGISEERDEDEFNIMRKAFYLNPEMKVLGSCRGLQLLNVFFGGSLFQSLDSNGMSHPGIHRIIFHLETPLSFLDHVNSLHHQGVKSLGTDVNLPACIVASEPKTGIPEIVCWGDRALGVQFHPEMFYGDLNSKFFEVIKAWVNGELTIIPESVLDEFDSDDDIEEIEDGIQEAVASPNPVVVDFNNLEEGVLTFTTTTNQVVYNWGTFPPPDVQEGENNAD